MHGISVTGISVGITVAAFGVVLSVPEKKSLFNFEILKRIIIIYGNMFFELTLTYQLYT